MIVRLRETLPVAAPPDPADAPGRERLRALAGEIRRWADGNPRRAHFTAELVRCCEIAAEHPDVVAEGALHLLRGAFARAKKLELRHGAAVPTPRRREGATDAV